MGINIISTGSFTSNEILDNIQLSEMVDTSEEWIIERTGIKTRHIASDFTTEDLAANACDNAIKNANLNKDDIQLIIVASVTSDTVVPSSSFLVSEKLDIKNCTCFDINVACSGFIYSITVAKALMASLNIKYAAVIGAEKLSKVVDWGDRASCVLFGDGAGCVILENTDITNTAKNSKFNCQLEIVANTIGGNFDYKKYLTIARKDKIDDQVNPFIKMNGRQIYKFATEIGIEVIDELLKKSNINKDELALIVPHQANSRIVDTLAEKSGIDKKKWFINIDKYGNTSSASVPIAMDEALDSFDFESNRGKYIISLAFGGGLSFGGILVKII
ncbi:MAG: beta-ketoacyl-ACP synthase 3 [Gallibacter sp.]|nr:beta-ketoacyl-ACP synthase 3 [Gallibacter sp.]